MPVGFLLISHPNSWPEFSSSAAADSSAGTWSKRWSIRAMRWSCRLGGARATLNLSLVLQRRLTITGSTLRPRSPKEKGEIADALQRHVWPLLDTGTVAPVVSAVFPLAQAAEAHRVLESGSIIGKIVLEM